MTGRGYRVVKTMSAGMGKPCCRTAYPAASSGMLKRGNMTS